jgi:hypothetical protein
MKRELKPDFLAGKVMEFYPEYKEGKGTSFNLDKDRFGGLKVYFGEENKPANVLHPCPDYEGVKIYVGKDK